MSGNEVLTMIPGPTPVHPEILECLARPTTSHQAPEFVETFAECLRRVKRIAYAERARPFVIAGSGTLAMEMALVNLLGPRDRLLVVSQGYFGDRWAELAEAFDIPHRVLRAEWGEIIPAERVEQALAEEDFAAVAVTHVDTSTGAAAPVEEYCRLLGDRRELTLLDGVCATAGMEERFDDWKLDVLLTGAQKALGTPPGVAILLASDRALARRRARASVPAYYADLLRWEPIMENPVRYFSTPPVNEILALHRAVGLVLEEGLVERFHRHERIAAAVRDGLAELGLEPFTAPHCRASTLSVARYPEGLDDRDFRGRVAEAGVVIAGGLGPLAGKACRIGHMGNIGPDEVCRTLEAIAAGLAGLGHDAQPARAVQAARARLGPA